MEINYLTAAIAALIPLIMGFIWYGPMLFKNAWMKEVGFTEESMKGANMALIFGLTFVFSFLAAIILQTIVIHQFGVQSALMKSGESALSGVDKAFFETFMATYGDRFRTFGHGALHGTIVGLFIAMPVMAINALFERKSWKYILMNVGYWVITLALMGGIICQNAF